MSLRDLGPRLAGEVVLPGDASWDVDRQVWNLAVDQRPMGIVWPRTADDVVATVRFAAERGLRIAFNAGGHNAGTIAWADDVLLLKTGRMDGIRIDPEARRARVEAGVLAKPLAQAAGEHGLAYLAGTSPDVGVLGYALGGGLSWFVRRHGLACDTIVAADVVTADGRLIHVDRESEPDVFWAIRGGGGNVGAVTSIELELFSIPQVYAGGLFWPIEQATRICGRGGTGSTPCPSSARRSAGCSSSRMRRSCPTICAVGPSCSSSSRSSATRPRATSSCALSVTSIRSSTPWRSCRRVS